MYSQYYVILQLTSFTLDGPPPMPPIMGPELNLELMASIRLFPPSLPIITWRDCLRPNGFGGVGTGDTFLVIPSATAMDCRRSTRCEEN